MINKKICMVGAFAVGKTSLVKQFVESIFSDKYHTTIGVKIDKKTMTDGDITTQLMIWDIEGVDVFTDLKPSYLRGASGIVLVVDRTRRKSLDAAKAILQQVNTSLTGVPVILIINKIDLIEEQQFTLHETRFLDVDSESTFTTSAKTGENVERAFETLVQLMTEVKK